MDRVREVRRDKSKFFHREYELTELDWIDNLIGMNSKNVVHRVQLDSRDREEFRMLEIYHRRDCSMDIEHLRYTKIFSS